MALNGELVWNSGLWDLTPSRFTASCRLLAAWGGGSLPVFGKSRGFEQRVYEERWREPCLEVGTWNSVFPVLGNTVIRVFLGVWCWCNAAVSKVVPLLLAVP